METCSRELPRAPVSASILPALSWINFTWEPTGRKGKNPPERPQPSLFKLALTLEDAGALYALLREKTRPGAHPKPPTAKPAAELSRLLETLDISLRELPATAPAGC